MYRLREMDIDDKVCEQVSMTMLNGVYPKEVIERCVQQSQPWSTKARRVRASTALALVLFVIGMALWSRLNQCQVWQSLVGKLSSLHPGESESTLSDAGLSGRRKELGSQCLQAVMRERCQLIAQRSTLPRAFFARYRLMAIDGTVFNTPDTKANTLAFGRSSNQYGPGAYPQVRCVLLAECGSHGVVGLEIGRYDVSEVHGAHRLLEQVGPDMLVMVDAGITSGGFLEHVRERRAHALGALEAGAWEHLSHQRRLCDGSVLAWGDPTRPGAAQYPLRRGMWVRIISYRVTDERLGEVDKVYRIVTTLLNPRLAPARELIALYHERWEIELVIDEIKTHERAQRKVLRSKTPEGVRQELYGIYLAHYAVRVLMAQAAVEAELDPDRLSFTEGLFELTEMISLALTLEPEEATEPLLKRLRHKMAHHVLPVRRLRIPRIAQRGCTWGESAPGPLPFPPRKKTVRDRSFFLRHALGRSRVMCFTEKDSLSALQCVSARLDQRNEGRFLPLFVLECRETKQKGAHTLMVEDTFTLTTFYRFWKAYQDHIEGALAPLTASQLALRAAPHLRSIGEQALHIVACRAHWFTDFLGEDGGEEMKRYASWNEMALSLGASIPPAAELVQGLDRTWQFMADCLARWSPDEMRHTFPDNWDGKPVDVSRAWVVWHVMEHDLHHGGELSLTLGMHRLPADFPG